jgi:hypothetical protein
MAPKKAGRQHAHHAPALVTAAQHPLAQGPEAVSRKTEDSMTDVQAQLNKVRSDAAECLLLSRLANSEKREMFVKMAEHLNSLAVQVERTVKGTTAPLVEHRSAAIITDLTATRRQPAMISGSAIAHQAARSRRILPWLLAIAAVLIIGVSFRTNKDVERFLSLRTLPSKEGSLVPQDDAKEAGLPSNEARERKLLTEQLGALAERFGSLEKENLKRARSEPMGPSNEGSGADERTAALTNDLATARRDLETKTVLLSKAGDETAQLRKTVEASTAALEKERKKTVALTNDLAIARRDLETKAALLSKAGGETAQPRETVGSNAEAKANTAAPVSEHPAISEQPATSGSKADSEVALLMTRAQSLLAQGNINAARNFLERAVEMGSAKASFAIAETYDPRVLSQWSVYGIRGDAAKARKFYAKAAAGGIEEAKDRLDSLHE